MSGESDLLKEAFLNIGKALQCPICLSVMRDPARLKCCHYFCHACLSRALEADKAPCPVCKAPAHRRDATRDPTLMKLTNSYRMECERAHLSNHDLGIAEGSNVAEEAKVDQPAMMKAGAKSANRREKKKDPIPSIVLPPPSSYGNIEESNEAPSIAAARPKGKTSGKRGRPKRREEEVEEEEVGDAACVDAPVVVAPPSKKPRTIPLPPPSSTPLPVPSPPRPLPPPTTGTTTKESRSGGTMAPGSFLVVPPSSEGRRIPSRLLPWACPRCTLHNQGASKKCQACKLKRSEAEKMARGASQQLEVDNDAPFDPHPPPPAPAPSPAPARRARKVEENEAEEGWGKMHGTTGMSPNPSHLPLGKRQAHTPNPQLSWGDKSIVVVGSGLGPGQLTSLKKLTDLSGSKFLEAFPSNANPPSSSSFSLSLGSQRVTHVVCQVDENGRARRTIKFLLGICHGCWVVSMAWVEACLKEKGRVEEGPYLVAGDLAGGEGGPRAGIDLNSDPKEPCRLLSGARIVLQGPFAAKNDIIQLVKAAGGILLPRPPPPSPLLAPMTGSMLPPSSSSFLPDSALEFEGGSMSIVRGTPPPPGPLNPQKVFILIDPSAQQQAPSTSERARGSGKGKEDGEEVYSYKWLLDCVGSMKMRDITEYRV